MSEDVPIGLMVAEKIFGLILIIIGAVVAYNSTNITTGDVSNFAGIFTVIGVVILAAGIFLVVVKTE